MSWLCLTQGAALNFAIRISLGKLAWWCVFSFHSGKSLWELILEQFDDLLVKILLLAAIISFVSTQFSSLYCSLILVLVSTQNVTFLVVLINVLLVAITECMFLWVFLKKMWLCENYLHKFIVPKCWSGLQWYILRSVVMLPSMKWQRRTLYTSKARWWLLLPVPEWMKWIRKQCLRLEREFTC